MAKTYAIREIRLGFERFFREHGRYPTALEVDSYPYLPSARQFQRRFGGLRRFRRELGHPITDFGKGPNRSKIASLITRRGRIEELAVQKLLTTQFGEPFVHVEKRFGEKGQRVDFFVYSPSGDFGIDVFSAASIHHVRTITSMKAKTYREYPLSNELFFLCANREVDQTSLDKFISNKKIPLGPNIRLISPATFARVVSQKRSYPLPDKST